MPENQQVIRNIINVNHAGEFGAVRLYSGQMLISKLLYPDMINIISKIRHDEKKHCALFLRIMPDYDMRPCRLTWIWAVAGFLMGITTPLLGRRGLLVSIKAAENTAHEHLETQIRFLESCDKKLASTISTVQIEELNHISISEAELGSAAISRYESVVYYIVYQLCQITMWIVTRGTSSQLKKALS